MRRDRGSLSRSPQLLRGLRSSWLVLATLALPAANAVAAELSATVPHTFHQGPPLGPAAMPGVDWSRAHRAERLPSPATAQVLWERQLSGGLSANLVVDAAGSVFAVSPGRVTQLAADGSEEYARQADFTSAVAVALLANGARVLLTREGRLLAWSSHGTPVFQVTLSAPNGYAHAGLLPLPQGGVLAHLGNSLFRFGAGGELEGYAELKREALQTLVDRDRVWIVASDGDVWTWNGRDPPAPHGSFPSRVSAAALSASGRLLAVVDAQDLVLWTAPTGPSLALAHVEELGSAPRISAPGGETIYLLGSSGNLLSVRSDEPTAPPSAPERASDRQRVPAGPGEVLASLDGTVAWLVPNAPLALRHAPEQPHLLPGVICHQPLSLVPAKGQRLIAGCKSGQMWMIGPTAAAPTSPGPNPNDARR